MARARNVKPGLFKNEILGVADPLYTLLFEGLWLLADREGRLEDRPVRIKGELFPYRDGLNVAAMLDWLEEQGFVLRYRSNGMALIQILQFAKHQTPHGTEKDSDLPDENGRLTVHVRGKNGYATGEFSLVNQVSTDANSSLTVKKPSENLLTPDSGFPLTDSGFLIPDSLTGSKEPEGASKPARQPKLRKPDDVSERTWMDWQQLRKAKRAPVTETVVDGARVEADKAGMDLEGFLKVWCRRGSQGLEAAWLKPHERGSPGGPNSQEVLEQSNRAIAARFLENDA